MFGSHWENVGLVFNCKFMDLACGAIHKLAEKELDQYFPSTYLTLVQLATPETSGRLGTRVRRKDIWDRLGNFRELKLVNSYLTLVTQTIPEIKSLHASAQSSRRFWSGQ